MFLYICSELAMLNSFLASNASLSLVSNATLLPGRQVTSGIPTEAKFQVLLLEIEIKARLSQAGAVA